MLTFFFLVTCPQYVNLHPIPTLNPQSATLIPKIIIHSAIAKGAVCLDGSPPAYHFSPGKGEDARCPDRAAGDLGSSLNITTLEFINFFGTNAYNTYFYKWNRVVIRYYDEGSFTGDVEKPDPVVFASGSTGGLGVLVHCDHFTSQFPKGVRVKCFQIVLSFLSSVNGGVLGRTPKVRMVTGRRRKPDRSATSLSADQQPAPSPSSLPSPAGETAQMAMTIQLRDQPAAWSSPSLTGDRFP
nr:pectin acetylesterase 8 [Ipomoea batatas]